ncbi:uncharacterized protein LOC131538978 isoform X2 [Onychostoma macrolepis]|nr:uncharacterized protein LOC131538978 isoform X2 [Onychostoma macrolepis]XP_058629191.1 uncharacterized protein LOC131538978 isoform X2 [Onychostoma macrolepis]
MAVVCTLQMMQTLQYSQSQQDDFAPSVFHIAVITRSMEIQIKVSPLQVEPYTLQVFLLPSCADLHFLLPLKTPGASPGTPRAGGLFPARSFQRSIHIAEIVNEKLSTSRTVVIRFLEADATVEGITSKVKDALSCHEPLTLTDSQGNEITDSEATISSHYWKQNSRKIYAIPEQDFVEFQNGRRAKVSRRSEDGSRLQEVIAKIDQLKQGAEGHQNITSAINQLSELAKTKTTAVMSNDSLCQMKDAFTCLVCKGICKICSSGYLYSQLVQLILFHVESNCNFQHQSFLCLKVLMLMTSTGTSSHDDEDT